MKHSNHHSNLLESFYIAHNIRFLKVGTGKFYDKLGDVYEDYIAAVFEASRCARYNKILRGEVPIGSMDEEVAFQILNKAGVSCIESVEIRGVPKRESGGEPKTDVWAVINGNDHVKMSIKQSKASNVTVAEFDVQTIAEEVGIEDHRLLSLLEKFQTDASAKYFTFEEKIRLGKLLAPHLRPFLNWVLSGCREDTSDNPQHANLMVMFKTNHAGTLVGLGVETLSECFEHLTSRSAGYGTGLSWTYATGTKGKKIQFKAPVTKPQVVWG